MSDGRIAIIAIGSSPVFAHIQGLANALKVPYISIKWDSLKEEKQIYSSANSLIADEEETHLNQINIHPPSHRLLKAIIDLIEYYRWDYITLLFQESTGLDRLEELIRLPRRKQDEPKFRIQIRQLGPNVDEWIYLIKDLKLSGSSHIIVDIETKNMNKFLKQAEEVGLMTAYFHFIFTNLDLSILDYAPSANITALQVYEPNDTSTRSIFAEFNLKNMVSKKPMFKFLPVN